MIKDTLSIYLTESGMNQNELAHASGLTPSAISQYLSGDREPTLKNLLLLSAALETTPNDLLGFHSDKRYVLQQEIVRLKKQIREAKAALK